MHRPTLVGLGKRSVAAFASTAFALCGLSIVLTLTPAVTRAGAGAESAAGAAAAPPARALVPVRGILGRRIDSAPAGADALRVSVLGDNSGGRLQVRLLAPGQDGALTGYFAAPEVALDFEGWKTLILPLSQFTFHSDNNPEITRDGLGTPEALANAVGVQFAVLSSASRVFLEDLAWAKADSTPTDPPLAVIDSFDQADAAAGWKSVGDYNERRSVDASINRVAAFVKSGGSLQMVVRSRAQTDQQLHEPALRVRLAKTPTLPYVVFARPPFETITSDSTPSPAETKPNMTTVGLFACAGEIEPGTFAVYSALPLKGATIALKGPLTATAAPVKGKASASLPASAVDLHVVRSGGTAENAPQLLMKDDRQPLSGPSPKVRLVGAPVTDIPAGSTKQFWITVRVPRNQAPGTYSGILVFSAPGVKPSGIPFTVEVLPLNLRTAHFQYGIDLPSVLQGADSPRPGERAVTPQEMTAQLANIRDHGIKLVTLHGAPSSLTEPLRLYKESGISNAGPVVIANPLTGPDDFSAIENLRSTVGLAPTFEFYYRLPGEALTDAAAAGRYAESARNANRNALVVAPVDSSSTYGELARAGGDAFAPVYAVSSDYAQKVLTEGRRFTPNRDWWSWNISQQSPVRNRLLAGFLLWKTGNGMYGAFPGPYQFVPEGTDPYSVVNASPEDATMSPTAPRPQLAAFPVEGGVLDTLQWEAVREGIDDVRYADVLKTLSREIKDLKIRKDATDLAESYLLGVMGKPLLSLSPREHQVFRREIANQCLKLQAILAKAPRSAAQ